MTSDQKKAYEWAKNQNYPSVAARYAKELAGLVDELQVASCARQEQERNAPLTLDELRKMDGEPVWVVYGEDEGMWALVEVCEESIFLTNNLGGRTEYANDAELEDDGLTVYRQKPEEGTV